MAVTRALMPSAAVVLLAGVCLDAGSQAPADIPAVRLDLPADPPKQVRTLPAMRLDDRPAAADLDRPATVSLTFSDPLPLRDVLLLLFRGTPFSIVFEPAVTGTFAGELSDLSLRQALEAVLFPAGMNYSVSGTVIRVYPRRPETRWFEVSRLDVSRSWTRSFPSSSAAGGTTTANLSTGTAGDAFADLREGLASLLSESGRFSIDRKAGLVHVTDFADRLDHVSVYLETLSVRSTRQVRLHARVIEVSLFGATPVDWSIVGNRSGVRTGPGAGIRVVDFDALIRAIAEFGTVRIIAAPQVLAMNNEPALMHIGRHGAGFFDVPAASAPPGRHRVDGDSLTLTVVPQIAADGTVQMSVSPSLTAAGGQFAPGVLEVDTTMRLGDGETAVISGFLRDATTTGSERGLAGIFGGGDRRTVRQELIVLLTPTVVAPGIIGTAAQ